MTKGNSILVNKKQERIKLLERQIERLRLRANALIPLSNRYLWSRVAIFFIGLALSVLLVPLVAWWAGLTLFIVTVVAFSVVAHYHRKIDRGIAGYTLWMHIKEAHVARMKLDWEHIPSVEEPTVRSSIPLSLTSILLASTQYIVCSIRLFRVKGASVCLTGYYRPFPTGR